MDVQDFPTRKQYIYENTLNVGPSFSLISIAIPHIISKANN